MKKNSPLISVIIPLYNAEKTIEKCVVALLHQSYSNIEIVIVDDGSIDSSAAVVRKLENNKIKYYYQENKGVSSARNLGIIKSKGDYITFVDADDFVELDYIEYLLNLLVSNGANISCCHNDYVDKYGNKLPFDSRIPRTDSVILFSERQLVEELIHWIGIVQGYCWGKLIDRDIVNVFFNTDLYCYEDLEFYIRLVTSNKVIFVLGEKTEYHYFINQNSALHQKYSLRSMSAIYSLEIIRDHLAKRFGSEYDQKMIKRIEIEILKHAKKVIKQHNLKEQLMYAKRIYQYMKRYGSKYYNRKDHIVYYVIFMYFSIISKLGVNNK